VFLPFGEFLGLAEAESIIVGSEKEKAELVVEEKNWPMSEARVGATGIFLSERCWLEVARIGEAGARRFAGGAGFLADGDENGSNPLTPIEHGGTGGGGLFGGSDSRVRLIPTHAGLGTHIYGPEETGKSSSFNRADDLRSEAAASAFHSGDMFKNFDTRQQMAEKGQAAREQEIEEVSVSAGRKRWMFGVWAITWFIPDFLIRWIGGMKRKDIQVAWREKLAINIMIWFMCGFSIFLLGKVFP
jgi:chitin synthase